MNIFDFNNSIELLFDKSLLKLNNDYTTLNNKVNNANIGKEYTFYQNSQPIPVSGTTRTLTNNAINGFYLITVAMIRDNRGTGNQTWTYTGISGSKIACTTYGGNSSQIIKVTNKTITLYYESDGATSYNISAKATLLIPL